MIVRRLSNAAIQQHDSRSDRARSASDPRFSRRRRRRRRIYQQRRRAGDVAGAVRQVLECRQRDRRPRGAGPRWFPFFARHHAGRLEPRTDRQDPRTCTASMESGRRRRPAGFRAVSEATMVNRVQAADGRNDDRSHGRQEPAQSQISAPALADIDLGPATDAAVEHSADLGGRAKPDDVEALANRIRSWQATGLEVRPDRQLRANRLATAGRARAARAANVEVEAETGAGPNRSHALSWRPRHQLGDPAQTQVVWQRPRFESAGRPTILLRDLRQLAGRFESFHQRCFGETAKYLAASLQLARDPALILAEVAESEKLDRRSAEALERTGRLVDGRGERWNPAPNRSRTKPGQPTVKGWGTESGDDLPQVMGNSSDEPNDIPGTFCRTRWPSIPRPRISWRSSGKARSRAACGLKPKSSTPIRRAATAWSGGSNIDTTSGPTAWTATRSDRASRPSIAPLELARRSRQPDGVGRRLARRRRQFRPDRRRYDDHGTGRSRPPLEFGPGRRRYDSCRQIPMPIGYGNAGVWQFVRGSIRRRPIARIPAGSRLAAWRTGGLGQQAGRRAGRTGRKRAGRCWPAIGPVADREARSATVRQSAIAARPAARGIGHDSRSARAKRPSRSAIVSLGVCRASSSAPVRPAARPTRTAWSCTAPGMIEVRVPADLFENYEFVTEATLSRPAMETSCRSKCIDR